MKVPNIIAKIFTNKYFLYLMVFLSFTNVIGYIILGNINAVIYFILIGLLVTIFSRNMSLVLFTALIFTNLIIVNNITPTQAKKEGFEGNENTIDNDNKKENFDLAPGSMEQQPPKTSTTSSQPEGYSGKNNLKGSKVDYASTVEKAYDNLNKILGSDSMSRLTEDTKHLMTQQQQLAESMATMAPLIESITPLLDQTKDMLGGMNIGSIDQIANLVTNFTGSNK